MQPQENLTLNGFISKLIGDDMKLTTYATIGGYRSPLSDGTTEILDGLHNIIGVEDWDDLDIEWIKSTRKPALNTVGALATLLAVTNTPSIEDLANAVGLTPNDLIAEAKAWEIAKTSQTE